MTKVWHNGSLQPGDASPGFFPVGAAFFETMALRQGRIDCLDDHLARVCLGLTHLNLPAGPLASGDRQAWADALGALGATEGILRLVVGPGFEEMGVRPILPSPAIFHLQNLTTVRDEPEWLPRPKSAPWANSLAATLELRTLGAGPGVEGVQLDARGHVSEATRSSLAWLSEGELLIPSPTTGCIPGTAQAQLVACCGLGVRLVATPPPTRADAVFLLRSTLPGGGVPVDRWTDQAGTILWSAHDLAPARQLLSRLADWRAQRSVSLA